MLIRTRGTLRLAMTLALLLLSAGLTGPARAGEPPPTGSGDLVAHRADGTPLGACPLKHTDVAAEISGFVARVVVTQTFTNPFPDPVEAIYTFPLSDRAAVDDMTMRTGVRVIRGEIERREEARRIYEHAKNAGQLASLLDQERPNVFTQSLANLMPGAEVQVRIAYVEPLKFADGTFEFSFPTVVGPRFVSGNPTGHAGTGWAPDTDRVPDASRVTPPVTPEGTRAGHDLAIAVDLDAGVALGTVLSPLHPITVDRPTPERARIALTNRREIPNRDFVLRYTVATDALLSTVLAHRAADGDGYLSLVLLPPRRTTADSAAPKELVFVIDRSGSQTGAPLDKAKETMRWIIDHLNPRDTFQIVDFGSEANVLFAKSERVTPSSRKRAREHIDTLQANGGTMMAEAVRRVTAMPADEHRLRVVTFMTDGYVGNDVEVLDLVQQTRGRSRWFPFGTGNSVNRFLIESMARLGGGEPEFVLLSDSGEAIARKFYERIASPVLTDVQVAFEGLDVAEIEPRALADVWAERPLVLHARYRKAGSGAVVLRGFRGGLSYEQRLAVTLPERESAHAAIASLWARARIDAILDEDLGSVQRGEVPAERRERVVALALAHRLMTPFTSFVAVEEKIVNEGGRQRTVTVPVEMPDGVRYEAVFGGAATAMDASARAPIAAMGKGLAMLHAAPDGAVARRAREEHEAARQTPLALEEPALADAAPPPPPASPRAQARLAPELLALATTAGMTPDPALRGAQGRVRVVVTLATLGDAERRALAAAGLAIEIARGSTIVGWIAIEKLVALAEVDGVERVVASAT
ncbi:MAG: VWA domain-containing protein [Deltaproteobacteria bacterium]|nr:VWA domain-containing protein [Deltaproteobacteria bacterium]